MGHMGQRLDQGWGGTTRDRRPPLCHCWLKTVELKILKLGKRKLKAHRSLPSEFAFRNQGGILLSGSITTKRKLLRLINLKASRGCWRALLDVGGVSCNIRMKPNVETSNGCPFLGTAGRDDQFLTFSVLSSVLFFIKPLLPLRADAFFHPSSNDGSLPIKSIIF